MSHHRRRLAAGPATRAHRDVHAGDWPQKAIVASLFFGAILLSVGAMVWNVGGLPVRGAVAIAGLGVMTLVCPGALAMAARRQAGLLLLLFGVALLGAVVSLLNDMSPTDLLQQIMEIHLQAAVFLLLAAATAELLGGGAVVLLFVSAIGVSALFTVAQFFDVGLAWNLRDAIADFTHEAIRYDRARPPGLAVTPVALATHLTLGLAAILVWRQRVNAAAGAPLRFDPVAPLATAVFCLLCLFSGNRSPILGAVVFFAVYAAVRAPRAVLVVAPLVLLAAPLAGMIFAELQGTGMRAFMTGDSSSEGRETLFLYGLRLFLDRPIGYGLGFAPMLYWGDHMELLLNVSNSQPALQVELHNYPLTMLNYYGIGILMILPPALMMMRRHLTAILPFLPYATHILFHNYGPFAKNDFLVFVAFAAVTMPLFAQTGRHGAPTPARAAGAARPRLAGRHQSEPQPFKR